MPVVSVVLLRLEGPLQAWSSQGKLGLRDTETEPTKSGVLGLVGAALGMDRSDDATLAELCTLAMAVRVDRPGTLLRDFHTAGGGRFRGEPLKVFEGGVCVPSERFYLQGASFLVALAGDGALVRRVAAALQSPRWPLFLGRRACVPSEPVFAGVRDVDSPVEALRDEPRPAETVGPLRVVHDADAQGDPRYDLPRSFAQPERRYGVRYVRTAWVDAPAPEASS